MAQGLLYCHDPRSRMNTQQTLSPLNDLLICSACVCIAFPNFQSCEDCWITNARLQGEGSRN